MNEDNCFHCNLPHRIYACPSFSSLTANDRYQVVKENRRCFACLSTNVRANCKSKYSCRTCGSTRHHTLLCSSSQSVDNSSNGLPLTVASSAQNTEHQTPSSSSLVVTSSADPPSVIVSGYTALINSKNKIVLLGTAKIHVADYYGRLHQIRAVLDSGSQRTIVTKECASNLALQLQTVNFNVSGVNSQNSHVSHAADLQIHSRKHYNKIVKVQAIVMENITGDLPTSCIHSDVKAKFKHLDLADDEFNHASKIDCLLGGDIFSYLLVNDQDSIIAGNPSAIHTIFGWVILGSVFPSYQNHTTTLFTAIDPVNETLQRFWATEEINVPKTENPNDALCEKIFISTTTRTHGGRYMVALPFSPDAIPVGANRQSAYGAFLSLEKRLANAPDIRLKYHNFLQEYLDLGHMTRAEHTSPYVIPNHCVFKRNDPHAKIRVVFNASAPDDVNTSLNERLLTGPKLQKNLFDILVSFRLHEFVITADCRQMYRQVLVRPEDRIHQHIFWRKRQTDPLIEYELNTVTYGLRPSAYLAQRVIMQLVLDHGDNYPLASHALTNHTYIDDLTTGSYSLETAQQLINELQTLLSLGGFELRKWTSNSSFLLSNFPSDHLENPLIFADESETVKILGIKWCPSTDAFTYNVIPFQGVITKRTILSYISQFFDPLGWITPVIFWAKAFMQRLWLTNLNLDSTLPEPLTKMWKNFSNTLSDVSHVFIPRLMKPTLSTSYLLGFCDASEKGYAAVLYLHSEFYDKTINIRIVASKSRVAPLKTLTIPRLELNAALLLAKLLHTTLHSIPLQALSGIRLHTDARIVLDWMHTPVYLLKIYVANRIAKLLELSELTQWAHIRITDNPADIASRGCHANEIIHHKLWWEGPSMYQRPEKEWPSHEYTKTMTTVSEMKPNANAMVLLTTAQNSIYEYFLNVSSFTRLLRIFAYVLRFIANCRKTSVNTLQSLSFNEINAAKLLVCRITQREYLQNEIDILEKGKTPHSLRTLSPFLGSDNLIHVGGRLAQAMLSDSAKFPILLPKKSHVTNLVIDYFHIRGLHAGPRTTQALIVQEFWISSVRSILRQRLRLCIVCFRFLARPLQPIMADLPAVRVTPQRAFKSTGIDFAGPFITKASHLRNCKTYKGYLCVFVCMVTKAVHLEYVTSLNTEAFLAALDRFSARRGCPTHVYTDNGTNFVGASKRFNDLQRHLHHSQEIIQTAMASRRIQWHFNPPNAPNFGGLWEAVVKSAKTHLHRIVGDTPLNYEEFSTLFARIEAVLNSRPLCDISEDPNEECFPLTPGHFLIGASLTGPPEQHYDEHLHFKTRWAKIKQLAQTFWHRWSREYIHTQIQRKKWNQSTAPLQVGQLVLLYGINTAPLHWPIGRVMELHPGLDGVSRVVTIRTATKTLVRPVNRVVPLPM